jgi:hypothetical protein
LSEKLRALFVQAGMTKEIFEKEFAKMELFEKLYRLEGEKRRRVSKAEKLWLEK